MRSTLQILAVVIAIEVVAVFLIYLATWRVDWRRGLERVV